MSRKTVHLFHVNHASIKTVKAWQKTIGDRIARLKKRGFVIAMLDEAFFVMDPKGGKKYWSAIGRRIKRPYTGRHKTIAVFGTVTQSGSQLFKTYDRFNVKTFTNYLKALEDKYGKIAIMTDSASVHKSKAIKKWLKKHPNVKLIWLPKGSPYLNAVEQCWNMAKHALLVSEYYGNFDTFKRAVSKYFRTTKFNLKIGNYIYRDPVKEIRGIEYCQGRQHYR